MKKTNQPEQAGKYWLEWETVQECIPDQSTHLMLDQRGQFHLLSRRDFIDGKAVPEDDHCHAKIFCEERGIPYDPTHVTTIVIDRGVTPQEAARLIVELAVPECLKPFIRVR